MPVLPVERVELQDDDGNDVYEGTYPGFTEEGIYWLLAYAWDDDGNLSLPRQAMVGGQRVYLPFVLRYLFSVRWERAAAGPATAGFLQHAAARPRSPGLGLLSDDRLPTHWPE